MYNFRSHPSEFNHAHADTINTTTMFSPLRSFIKIGLGMVIQERINREGRSKYEDSVS